MNQAQRNWIEQRINCVVRELISDQLGEAPVFDSDENIAKAVSKHNSLFAQKCVSASQNDNWARISSVAEKLPTYIQATKKYQIEQERHDKQEEKMMKKYAARVNDIMLRVSMGEVDADGAIKLLSK